MTKRITLLIHAVALVTCLAASQAGELERSFATPPASCRPWTWWHWMNGNISKEGITADLQAMRDAGIGGAQIFDIGLGLPEGEVAYMSPEWLACFRHALKEADRLGLEIGVNCSAGWANSGGPWIKAKDSMKRLVATETVVQGPAKFVGDLPQGSSPGPRVDLYGDVALFAVGPSQERLKPVQVSSSLAALDADRLQDDLKDHALKLPQGTKNHILLDFGQTVSPRTFFLRFGQEAVYVKGELSSSSDGVHFEPLRQIDIAQRWDMPRSLKIYELDGEGAPPAARYFKLTVEPQIQRGLPELRETLLDAFWLSPQVAIDKATAKSGDNSHPFEYDFLQLADAKPEPGCRTILRLDGKLQKDGHLEWDVPAGVWTLLRVGYISAKGGPHPTRPSSKGLECDRLDSKAMDAHWRGLMEPLLREAEGTRSFTNALIDSYEIGGQNWTPGAVERFQAAYGYDPVPFLPAIFGVAVSSKDASERFLRDWRTFVSDTMAENYFGHFAKRCAQAGLRAAIEPYWGPFDCLAAGRAAAEPMGEFWFSSMGGNDDTCCRLAASVAHVQGRPVVAAESFTSCESWNINPGNMKIGGDKQLCAGLNKFVLHSYVHQPFMSPRAKPGLTLGRFGAHFGRNETWWPFAKAWMDYLARCQFMLRQGRPTADVCVFSGENAPNHALKDNALANLKAAGHDYDFLDRGSLVDRLVVKDGVLSLPSVSYRLLSVRDSSVMSVPVLKALARLLEAGGVVLAAKPGRTPGLAGYPESERELAALADKLWGAKPGATGDVKVGQGRLLWGISEEEALKRLGVAPDFDAQDKRLAWVHRSTADAEIYFVSNQTISPAAFTASFRVAGMTPELWNPVTGAVVPAALYVPGKASTQVALRLPESGSVFVVFKKDEAKPRVGAFSFKPAGNAGLAIVKATYGALDGSKLKDVTEALRQRVRGGKLALKVGNEAFGGDPAPLVVKRLSIDYALNDIPGHQDIGEGGELSLESQGDCQLRARPEGGLTLRFRDNGVADVQDAAGRHHAVSYGDLPPARHLEGPWKLSFPADLGAPDSVVFERLRPLPEADVEGVRHFSGVVSYEYDFEAPGAEEGRDHLLSLGSLGEGGVAAVELNGLDLGVVWTPPFEVDASKALKPGMNHLRVKLATPWANRLIGDLSLPDDCQWSNRNVKSFPDWLLKGGPRPTPRVGFVGYDVFDKGAPLLKTGLLGPVRLCPVQTTPVELE